MDKLNFEGHLVRECGEHRTVGPHRAWCYDCSQWCYPNEGCCGCEVARLRAERDTLAAALATVEGALAAYWENNPPGTPGYNPAVAAALDLLTSRVALTEHTEEPT